MKYLTVLGFGLLFAFLAIFIISAREKNIYAFGVGELCAFAGIACLIKANKNQRVVA
jgi:hypothetical protein